MQKSSTCPYLEKRDTRCAYRLSLESLREAFTYCAGDYASCTIYQQIRLDNREPAEPAPQARSA